MFNFQGSELIIILLLALVVLGPEKLPDAMRRLGRFYADLKKMSSGFQEEFRAAVDEPVREVRETANTLRDSLDFRKLADGERDEKPKSADMAPSDLAPADVADVPTEDVPFQAPTPSLDETQHAASVDQTSTPPAPPAPFSSSQAISAAAPAPKQPDESTSEASVRRIAPQMAVEDEHGLREARPADQDGAA